jgi:hypothetical protein
MTRLALPDRRQSVTILVTHGNHEFTASFGLDHVGRVKEVFYSGLKTGTDMAALITDACILISILLQYGMSASQIAEKLGENKPEGSSEGSPASVIGTLSRAAAELETPLKVVT